MSDASNGAARAGLMAKGVLYALLAVLALQIALGNAAEADSQGALRAVAARPFGAAMLVALALGFAGYAGWQMRCAVRGDEWFARLAAGTRAIVWSGLAVTAAKFIFDRDRTEVERSLTGQLLDTSFGPWLVGAAGLVMIAVGLSFLRQLRDQRYFDDLKPMSGTTRRFVKAVTVTGVGAKAGVYTLAGAFLVRAAAEHRPNSGIGLDGALSTVAQQPFGTYVLAAVAGGLAAYALWCWVRARYERVEHSDG